MKGEIELALAAHAAWRKRFRDYLNGRASIDLATIAAGMSRVLAISVFYALVGIFFIHLLSHVFGEEAQTIWPGSGFAVVALLLGGNRYAAGIFLGAWLGVMHFGLSLGAALAIAGGTTLESLVIHRMLVRGNGFDVKLGTLGDFIKLLVSGSLGAIIGAGIGTMALTAIEAGGGESASHIFVRWWVTEIFGTVLFVPLILVWRRLPDWYARGRLGEAVLVIGLTFLVGQAVFLNWFHSWFGSTALGYWMFLFIAWTAIRLGQHGVLLALLLIGVQGMVGTLSGIGFISMVEPVVRLPHYGGYMLLLTIVGLALATDIDNLSRTRASLIEAEGQLNRAQAVAKIGSWVLDIRSNMLSWSPENYRIFGIAPGTPLSYETFLACVHPDDRAYVDERWKACLLGEPYDIEHRIVANGKVRWVNERAELHFAPDGQLIGGIGVTQDVTAQKSTADELLQYRLHLENMVKERTADLTRQTLHTEAILRTMLDGVMQIDANGRIVSINDAIGRIFGYEEDELLGRNVSLLMPEPHRSAHDSYIQRYLENRNSRLLGRRREVNGLHKDGTSLPLELAVHELLDDAGITFIGVLTDIRDRKVVETEREASRSAALKLAKAKSDFLANMSHEIRTPLNAVLGFARIGERDSADPRARSNFRFISDAGEHLLGVINDILDFSKLEANKYVIESTPFQLTAMIANVDSMIGSTAAHKGLTYTEEVCNLPSWVMGDAQRLQQILINLLGNAIKFTEHGEIRLSVRWHDGVAIFCIGDTGIGISAEQLSRLFNPFEQADGSTTRRYGGSGLGLAISQRLAKLMGGEITVESEPGKGSEFILTVPLPDTSAPAHSAATQAVSRSLQGIRILAAEDVEVNRMILADLLEEAEATYFVVENGQQAVDFIAKDPSVVDIVLMDVQMPVMDGLEATRSIRRLAPDLPIIGLTAHALAEERRKCLDAGMVDHATKPIEPEVLLAMIHRWVPLPGDRTAARAPSSPGLCDASMENAVPSDSANDRKPTLDTSLLARLVGNDDMRINKYLMSFRDSLTRVAQDIRTSYSANEWGVTSVAAHKLKSSARTVGALALGELCASIEHATKDGNASALELLIHDFENELAAVKHALGQQIG